MKYLRILSLLFVSITSNSQDRILVDGIFNEWSDYPIIYSDAAGDGGSSGIDFGQLQIYNDDEYIFFLLESGSEINLQDLNEIFIYLDTDDNSNTGFSINGIGAEIVYSFGNRSGFFYQGANSSTIQHSDIGLVTAPTVTSSQFEIAIRRDIIISGIPVFQSDNLKIVFQDDFSNGDLLPASNEEITYTFSNNNSEPLPDFSIQKFPESDLRVISYNVLFNGVFDPARIPSFTRLLQAIEPDIIGFQEIYDFSSAQVASQVESMLPSSTGQQWFHAKEGPDCHAISRYPILESALIPGYNQNAGNGAFLIDVAGIETGLLLIVAHPPCCGNNEGRQIEVDLIMEFLREAKEGNGPIPLQPGAPIVILGDMNLVGDHRQLETLLTGNIFDESSYGPDFIPDWDDNNLLDSHPYVTGLPFSFSWYNEESNFSPGRLDYIIYSGSNLMLQNSFSLFTPGLSQDNLNALNLFANDAIAASDHLPLVVDFELNNLTAQKWTNGGFF
jgi:exonuclease III